MILIAGDSWSVGEWSHSSNIHNGFGQYLHDNGHFVCNLGVGGGWNGLSVSRLDSFLNSNTYNIDQISHIFVFQTEWIRDVLSSQYPYSNLFVEQDFDYDYQTLKNRVLSRFYHSLSNIATQVNKTIFIIGGASDTSWLDKFSTEYPNLEIVCQSFTNLLVNNNHRINDPVYSLYSRDHDRFVNKLKELYIDKDFRFVLDDMDLASKRIKIFNSNKEFFWPDFRHPNRKAHKILFDFINKNYIV